MSDQPIIPTAAKATPTPGQPVRAEGLLPADQSDPDLQVAEEVAFDLQSGQARNIGGMPTATPVSKPAEAVAESLAPNPSTSERDQAVDRAVPPSP